MIYLRIKRKKGWIGCDRMKKAEYIQVMEKALVGNVSPQELSDIISYYRDYIDMEIQKGKTEQLLFCQHLKQRFPQRPS